MEAEEDQYHQDMQSDIRFPFPEKSDNALEQILNQKQSQIDVLKGKIDKMEDNYKFLDNNLKQKVEYDFEFKLKGRAPV